MSGARSTGGIRIQHLTGKSVDPCMKTVTLCHDILTQFYNMISTLIMIMMIKTRISMNSFLYLFFFFSFLLRKIIQYMTGENKRKENALFLRVPFRANFLNIMLLNVQGVCSDLQNSTGSSELAIFRYLHRRSIGRSVSLFLN